MNGRSNRFASNTLKHQLRCARYDIATDAAAETHVSRMSARPERVENVLPFCGDEARVQAFEAVAVLRNTARDTGRSQSTAQAH